MTQYKMTNQMQHSFTAWLTQLMGWLVLLAAVTLAGCGGGEATTQEIQQISGTTSVSTSADMTSDKTRFNTQLWANINRASAGGGNAGCGSCHTTGGSAGQHNFADRNSLDTAYDSITMGNPDNSNRYLNRTYPEQSGLVTKVASGHNCWLSTPAACAAQMTTWITNWLQPTGSTGTVVTLSAPAGDTAITDGQSRIFPATPPAGYNVVHDLLTDYCSGCHVPGVAQAQQPYFAVADINSSYSSVVSNSKINLVNAAESRLYRRLVDDRHNCWSDCASNGAEMLLAIQGMIANIAVISQEAGTQVSRVVTLEDGISISGGSRVDTNAIAVYEFKEGSGNVIRDSISGVDLQLIGSEGTAYQWLPSWGIRFNNSSGYAIASNSTAIRDAIVATNSYSVEAWVVPANVAQMDANIVSFSANSNERFFTLAQYGGRYQAFNRSTSPVATNATAGLPLLQTSDGDALATLQHVVVTYTASQGRRIYINGTYTEDADNTPGAGLGNWIAGGGYQLKLGGEGSGQRPWMGTLRKVVIHNAALTSEQIQQNFTASVGQKYLLMFDISSLLGSARGTDFVSMMAEEFDNYSYLFYKPTYIRLTGTMTDGIPVRGIRVGLNGREAAVGQAFASVNATLNSGSYVPGNSPDSGQVLSYIGTVIPKENGPYGGAADKFFLSFEEVGTNVATKNYNPTFSEDPVALIPTAVSDVMLRGFEEISATLSELTGINRTRVATTYDRVYQQLPPTEAITGFAPSQQTGITELAIAYCDQLAGDATRSTYFPSVTFGGMSFAADANRDAVIDPLLNRLLNGVSGTPANQPSIATVRTELRSLIGALSASCGGTCSAQRTEDIVTATCAAAFGSAPMLLQ